MYVYIYLSFGVSITRNWNWWSTTTWIKKNCRHGGKTNFPNSSVFPNRPTVDWHQTRAFSYQTLSNTQIDNCLILTVTGSPVAKFSFSKCHRRLVVYPEANVQPLPSMEESWRFQNKWWLSSKLKHNPLLNKNFNAVYFNSSIHIFKSISIWLLPSVNFKFY